MEVSRKLFLLISLTHIVLNLHPGLVSSNVTGERESMQNDNFGDNQNGETNSNQPISSKAYKFILQNGNGIKALKTLTKDKGMISKTGEKGLFSNLPLRKEGGTFSDLKTSDDKISHRGAVKALFKDCHHHVGESGGRYDGSETGIYINFGMSSSKKNNFKCPPCVCTVTHSNHIQAHCMGKHLKSVPNTLPKNITYLDMSRNPISYLNISEISEYTDLLSFELTGVRILVQVSNDSVPQGGSNLQELDLSGNKISEAEDSSFQFLSSLLYLNLAKNSLQRVNNMTFQGLVNLRTLDLSRNAIFQIDVGAFDCLTKLKTLNLSHNTRFSYSNHHMHPRLFMPLQELRILYIQGNSGGFMQYPNVALATLKNLQKLVIDGLHSQANFGPELRSLRSFKALEFGTHGGKCYLVNITDTIFENIPYLNYLALEKCHLKEVHANFYKKIPHLSSLRIDWGEEVYTLFQAFEDLKGLQNSSLKSLSFNRLYQRSLPWVILKAEHARYLQNIALEELDLSFNYITFLQHDFNEKLPRSLKRLLLRNNAFGMKYALLNWLSFLTKLIELDVSNQNIDSRYTKFICYKSDMCHSCVNKQDSKELQKYHSLHIDDPNITSLAVRPHDKGNVTYSTLKSTVKEKLVNVKRLLWLPPKLRIIRATRYTDFGMDLFARQITTKHSLQEIDLSNSFMAKWGYGQILDTIVKADLSQNYCKYIHSRFFPFNNSLRSLNLSNNFLGPSFADDENGNIFHELKFVNSLDISTNLIYRLSDKFLTGLEQLMYIHLSDNKLQALNISFATNRHISFINATKNSISWIGRQTRDNLDDIAGTHLVALDLTYNPLPCTCEGLEILEWLSTTKVSILNKDFLKCTTQAAHAEDIGNLELRINELQRQCRSTTLAVVLISVIAALLITFIGLSLIYRYRWRLIYLRNVALTRLFRNYKAKEPCDFPYDAFIVHTETAHNFVLGELRQELKSERGHKLCIPEVDFMPGSLLVTDILAAVTNSMTTVVICTPDIMQDTWAEYSVKMALNVEHFRKRKALFLILIEQETLQESHGQDQYRNQREEDPLLDHDSALGKDLLLIKQRGDFIEYPLRGGHGVTEAVRKNFWDRISEKLGHTSNVNQPTYVDDQ
ncbi:toll-like receptor m [Plakobranchus ocellatus]|uniref:Toll-like receptor m n=1 Tax=Plakobranchus ocellatus TaxID=259542 RepID=A0AAV4CNJ5_9GAST|nr:toll-like receptor m [Plakobranchus ocellatus]